MPSLQRAKGVLTRRRFLAGGAIAAGAAAIYAGGVERHMLTTERKTVRIRNLPAPFHGFRIAQLSDFHFRDFDEPYFVRHAVSVINALAPDAVAMTGDFITASYTPGMRKNMREVNECAEILSGISCPVRVCSMGNHDTPSKIHVVEALRSNKLSLLMNDYLAVERRGERIWLAGVADAYYDTPNLAKAIPQRKPNEPVILLGHEPDFADTVAENGFVDLMLAGHTHGGQVRIPLMGALLLPAMGEKYVEGLFPLKGGMQLYVNRGLGCMHIPIRFDCPPELTLLTLQPA